jgi:DNA-binding NarL/FixJ family response regulator
MIRVMSVDDHPALQAGLQTVLRTEPGLIPVGTAASEFELWPVLERTRPDVVLLDYHLPRSDGLLLCHRIKQTLQAPRVLIYSAYADASLAVPAVIAGADGLLHKSAPANDLFNAIRTVAGGERLLPKIPIELQGAAAERLLPDDRPIVAMVIDGATEPEIREALRLDPADLAARIERMIGRLRVAVPGSAA